MRDEIVFSHLLKRDPTLQLRYDKALDVFRHLRGDLALIDDGTSILNQGLAFLKAHQGLFGDINVDQLKLLAENTDRRGGRNVILQQYHGPYRVYGGSVRFHVSQDGIIDTISNHLFPDLLSVPPKPKIDVESAVRIAREGAKTDLSKQEHELVVYRHKGKARLVWELIFGREAGESAWREQIVVSVDAITGALLLYYDNIPSAGPSVGTGNGKYSGKGAVNTWDTSTTYQLLDATRIPGGPEIITNDANAGSPAEDLDNMWDDNLTSNPRNKNQGPLVDVHRYVADVYQYFQTHHGRNSWDNQGGNFEAFVHGAINTGGAFWGNTSKSSSSPGVTKAVFGDGDIYYDYCCCDDFVAHEFTHAYEAETSNLRVLDESGALKEAICDIFAAFITGDWLVFEDSWLGTTAPAARNMRDPTNGGKWDNSTEATAVASYKAGHCPSHYSQRYVGMWDNGGVHINAGIIDHLFFLLTVGGTHAISNVSVTGIGQSPAEQLLYNCMAKVWDNRAIPDAQFLDFRQAMLDSCLDLFPCDYSKLSQVKNAFNAVGVGPDIYVRDNLSDTGLEPYPGTYVCASPDIINRTTPSTNPSADFANISDDGLSENVASGQDNYVYVRLQNRGAESGDATIRVYVTPATTFGTPTSWTYIGILVETAIAPSSLRIAGPLTFPQALIPTPGHYCMIAVVSSALDPAPDLTCIATVSDYYNTVVNCNNIAFHNMEVFDLWRGSRLLVEVEVRTLHHAQETFDLHIDVTRFVPGAKLKVYGPRAVLDGAISRGLKLVSGEHESNEYELLAGVDLARHRKFAGHGESINQFSHGFERMRIKQDFRLRLECILPEADQLARTANSDDDGGYWLRITQLWHGQAVGAFTVKFRIS